MDIFMCQPAPRLASKRPCVGADQGTIRHVKKSNMAKAKAGNPKRASKNKTTRCNRQFMNSLLASSSSAVKEESKKPCHNGRIRLGSDCSGYGSDFLALALAGVGPIDVVFVAECDDKKLSMLKCLHSLVSGYPGQAPSCMYADVTTRDNKQADAVDLFVSGAPCPPWSSAGKQQGLDDLRGVVLFHSLDYVKHKHPKVVILENVQGLAFGRNMDVLRNVVKILENLGYKVKYKAPTCARSYGELVSL